MAVVTLALMNAHVATASHSSASHSPPDEATKAARLLTWHEAIGNLRPETLHANALLAPLAYLARGHILEAQGSGMRRAQRSSAWCASDLRR